MVKETFASLKQYHGGVYRISWGEHMKHKALQDPIGFLGER